MLHTVQFLHPYVFIRACFGLKSIAKLKKLILQHAVNLSLEWITRCLAAFVPTDTNQAPVSSNAAATVLSSTRILDKNYLYFMQTT